VEITAVEMDGQAVLMQDCPECHGLRVMPYWLAGDWTA
jgi:hypothetical protein